MLFHLGTHFWGQVAEGAAEKVPVCFFEVELMADWVGNSVFNGGGAEFESDDFVV